MADLTITTDGIRVVNLDQPGILRTLQATEAITAGQTGYILTTGKVGVADANAAGKQQTRVIAFEDVASGAWGRFIGPGAIIAGYTTAANYDDPLFQSDTAGAIADAAGTLSVPIGLVYPVAGAAGTEKAIYFSPRYRQDYT
jgi:hypothetical protein